MLKDDVPDSEIVKEALFEVLSFAQLSNTNTRGSSIGTIIDPTMSLHEMSGWFTPSHNANTERSLGLAPGTVLNAYQKNTSVINAARRAVVEELETLGPRETRFLEAVLGRFICQLHIESGHPGRAMSAYRERMHRGKAIKRNAKNASDTREFDEEEREAFIFFEETKPEPAVESGGRKVALWFTEPHFKWLQLITGIHWHYFLQVFQKDDHLCRRAADVLNAIRVTYAAPPPYEALRNAAQFATPVQHRHTTTQLAPTRTATLPSATQRPHQPSLPVRRHTIARKPLPALPAEAQRALIAVQPETPPPRAPGKVLSSSSYTSPLPAPAAIRPTPALLRLASPTLQERLAEIQHQRTSLEREANEILQAVAAEEEEDDSYDEEAMQYTQSLVNCDDDDVAPQLPPLGFQRGSSPSPATSNDLTSSPTYSTDLRDLMNEAFDGKAMYQTQTRRSRRTLPLAVSSRSFGRRGRLGAGVNKSSTDRASGERRARRRVSRI